MENMKNYLQKDYFEEVSRTEEFDENVKYSKKSLEDFLFDKKEKHVKYKELFGKIKRKGVSLGASIEIAKIGSLHIPYPSGMLAYLSKISGTADCALTHEVGETLYMLPIAESLSNLSSKNLIKLLDLDISEDEKTGEVEVGLNFSVQTDSDFYGDFLDCTLSPLLPESQLELIECVKENTKYTPENLTRKEKGFVNTQEKALKNHWVRGKERKEERMLDLFEELLEMQKGFNKEERKQFQLELYDTVQSSIRENLEKLDTRDITLNKLVLDKEKIRNKMGSL